MAVVLIYRGKLVDDFSLDVVGADHYHHSPLAAFVHLLKELLIVFLEPDVLVELCEGERKSEGVPHSRQVLELAELPIEEVKLQLVNCQKALQTRV